MRGQGDEGLGAQAQGEEGVGAQAQGDDGREQPQDDDGSEAHGYEAQALAVVTGISRVAGKLK